MINPFDFDDYRKFLNDLCSSPESVRGFRAQIARAAGCQASYFSQVLKYRVHFTDDQLLGVATHLNLISSETDYLLLLLHHDKAATPALKGHLARSIRQAREEHVNMKKRTGASGSLSDEEQLGLYFSSWVPSAIHLLTSSPRHQAAAAIADRLGLPLVKVRETLEMLERFGLIHRHPRGWEYAKGSLHVKKDSPFQSAVQGTRREMALRSIAINGPEAVHFSSVFTIDAKELEEIKRLSGKFVEQSHGQIQASGSNKLACICLDVFEVV